MVNYSYVDIHQKEVYCFIWKTFYSSFTPEPAFNENYGKIYIF